MAKPTKKRDLRARLGRTITPKTGGDGAPAAPPPTGGPAPNAGSAPGVAEPIAAPVAGPAAEPAGGGIKRKLGRAGSSGGVTPPPGGLAAPPPGIGGSSPGGLVAPPFGAEPEKPPPAAGPSDPFSAPVGVPAEPQVVRLEFDDKLIKDVEVGKGQRFKLLIVAVVVGAVSLVVGAFGGSTYENNKIFTQTVNDAQAIYRAIDDASDDVTRTQTLLNAMVTAAAGDANNGVAPAVSYESIEALRAIEKPIDANTMAGKNYKALPAGVVHDLFAYLNNVQRLWDEFRSLAGTTLAEARRAELDRTATATGEGASTRYGAVLSRAPVPEGAQGPGSVIGSLAFLSINEDAEGVHIMMRGTRGGPAREFQAFTGEEEITNAPTHVLEIDGSASRGVLAEQTGAFGDYLQTIVRLKQLADQTVELQGRLITAIAQALSEAGVQPGAAPEGGE